MCGCVNISMKVYARLQNGMNLSLQLSRVYYILSSGTIRLFFPSRYYDVLRRHNYVTPTSYLELILTFKTLLGVKQSEILGLKNRYVTGLEKLEFAASQVSVMQEELTALQPELIQTSAETEKLMVKIELDTVEVEAKKEVRH